MVNLEAAAGLVGGVEEEESEQPHTSPLPAVPKTEAKEAKEATPAEKVRLPHAQAASTYTQAHAPVQEPTPMQQMQVAHNALTVARRALEVAGACVLCLLLTRILQLCL